MAKTTYYLVKYHDVYCGIPIEGFCLMTRRELEAWKKTVIDRLPADLCLGGSETISYETADNYFQRILIDTITRSEYNTIRETIGVQFGSFITP